MDPLLLVLLAGGGLAVVAGKAQADAATGDGATAGAEGNADRDATLHDEIIPALNAVLPGTQAVAQIIGEEAVEDISDFFARIDDRNRQNIETLSNDLAKLDDKVRTGIQNIGNRIADVFGW